MNNIRFSNWKDYLDDIKTKTETKTKTGTENCLSRILEHAHYIYALSGNPNIKLVDFISNPGLGWNYDNLTKNESIPINYIIETSDKYPWNKFIIFKRIHFSQIESFKSAELNYLALSSNKTIPLSYVLKHKNKIWDWRLVVDHILTEYDVLKYPQECSDIFLKYIYDYNINSSCYENLSVKFIYELSFKYKGFMGILSQKASIKFILEHNTSVDQETFMVRRLNWNWNSITFSKAITISDILSHPDLPWNYNFIEFRDDLTVDLYLKICSKVLISKKLLHVLSQSKYITITDVINHPEIPWDYRFLSKNSNITWKIIDIHPELPWDFKSIAYNDMSCPVECKRWKSIYDEIIHELNY